MPDLERRLRELASAAEFPPTPQLSARVGREVLEPSQRPSRAPSSPRLRIALIAVAALLLLAASATAAIPSARNAVLDLLGLRAETIQRVPELPENVRARPQWRLGRPAPSLAAARAALAFRPLLPSGLTGPNGVFVGLEKGEVEVPGSALTLTYPPQPGLPSSRLTGVGLLLLELHGRFWPGFVGKLTPRDARIEKFSIDGDYAIWIEGLHAFFFHAGSYRITRSRLAANTLLVQRGETMVRLEGKFGKAKAIEIARSLTPVRN
ncbi:MAG TPA: hypothetical protein VGO36_04850 [Solirubrobacterales bacterium]|jgi:hypothetical protein|nr:hypothetical protein [Solirubrobacterales bacterium]